MDKKKYLMLIIVVLTMISCGSRQSATQNEQSVLETDELANELPEGWEALIDANSLKGWEIVRLGGEGEPFVRNGILTLPRAEGGNSTGVRLENGNSFPAINYAIYYEARRVEGSDIFAGMTFPYGDTYASLIVGGWGGALCGLSSIDGEDASSNETTTHMHFVDNEWYPVYLRVTADSIRAIIDTVKVVDLATAGRRIHLRSGTTAPSLTFTTFRTTGQIRNMRVKKL